MQLDIIVNLNNDLKQKQFLRENSYWYKYLNRDIKYYKDFINDMKIKYKLTTPDKIQEISNNLNMFKSLLDVLK